LLAKSQILIPNQTSRHAKQKEEDGELWVVLKFQKSPLRVSLPYNTSLNHLGKGWSIL